MRPTVSAAVLLLVVAMSVVAVATPARTADPAQVSGTPDIEIRPETLQFPTGAYGSDTRSLTVLNVGDAPLTVRSIDIVGPDQASFERTFDGPVTIEAGGRREVAVSFEPSSPGPRFATMHVLSDDPDEPQSNVWLTNTRTIADVSPSRVLETRTLVNATVHNAEADTTQSLNLSWPLTRDDRVAVDAVSFTPGRDGNITLSVATNASQFGDVPAFVREDGTEPAGFVRVHHSIANADVGNVTFTLRVRKDQLAGDGTGPEDVAFYRFRSGTWTELPTRTVEEGRTHYFFEAHSPGFSDFATGIKQARFRITDAIVTLTRITTDEGTEVLVRVRNIGGADGTYAVKLLLEDTVVDRRELSIAPNGTRQATFERSFDAPGTYEVYVNDLFVGNVTVDPAATATPSTRGDGDTPPSVGTGGTSSRDDRPGNGQPLAGFGPGTAVVALLLTVLLRAVCRRR